jgi:hypothetical protein
MDESFSLHKEKNTQVIIIHETFLILRYLSWGLALIISVSLYHYLKVLLMDGPLMCFVPKEDQIRIRVAEFDLNRENSAP